MVHVLDAPAATPPAPPSADLPAAARGVRDVLARKPGWPVVVLFVGYPLWWALGVTDVVGLIAAVAMVVTLLERRTVRVPPAFGVLLLFLVWVVLSFALVRVAAPGAVAAVDVNRYFTAGWRLLWYLKAAILLVYLGNERHRLSQTWICRTLGWMFVWIVAGGLLGVLLPGFAFTSLAEVVLPHGLATTQFVYADIHPVAAEAFTAYSGGHARTSAPFAYSNVWGLNFACFLPFFVAGWLFGATRRRQLIARAVLVVAIVPVALSLNRGLWIALGAMLVLVALRWAIAGHLARAVGLAVGAALLVAIIAATPLGATIVDRLGGSGPSSEQTRSNLTALTLTSTRDASPLVGFGATRSVQGSFNSIAGGATVTCPRCVVPSLGTQGQLLFVIFTQGFVGALLYFGFLLVQFFRHIALRSRHAIAGLAVLVAHLVTSTVYSADNLAILAIFAAVALLWRADVEVRQDAGRIFAWDEPVLADLGTHARRHWRPAVALLVLAAVAGAVVAAGSATVYRATVSVYFPDDPVYAGRNTVPTTLDELGQAAKSSVILNAMRVAGGSGVPVRMSRLSVTATANTKILHLTYAGSTPGSARDIADAAAQALVRLHRADLQQQRQQVVAQLADRAGALLAVVHDAEVAATQAAQPGAVRPVVAQLGDEARDNAASLAAAQRTPLAAGTITGPAVVRIDDDRRVIDITNGIAVGLLLVSLIVLAGRLRTLRLSGRETTLAQHGLPVLARVDGDSFDERALYLRYCPTAVVAAGKDPAAARLAASLDARIDAGRRAEARRVVVVVGHRERERVARRVVRSLTLCGGDVLGLLTVGEP